jgi:hypothetical protein
MILGHFCLYPFRASPPRLARARGLDLDRVVEVPPRGGEKVWLVVVLQFPQFLLKNTSQVRAQNLYTHMYVEVYSVCPNSDKLNLVESVCDFV